jgi:hypothetical protein
MVTGIDVVRRLNELWLPSQKQVHNAMETLEMEMYSLTLIEMW